MKYSFSIMILTHLSPKIRRELQIGHLVFRVRNGNSFGSEKERNSDARGDEILPDWKSCIDLGLFFGGQISSGAAGSGESTVFCNILHNIRKVSEKSWLSTLLFISFDETMTVSNLY